jgi:hypothetical protein
MSAAASERVVPVSQATPPQPLTPKPLSFILSRGNGASIVVQEADGRSGGMFAGLSSAIRFIETQCLAHKCPVDMRFDPSLALIRAAG